MDAVVKAIIENAERLLSDAILLADHGSYRTAESIAVLSMEEAGKACLVHWKRSGLLKGPIELFLRGHIDKQRILNSYRAVKAILSDDDVELRNDPLPTMVYTGRDKQIKETLYKVLHEKINDHVISVESGITDLFKQGGFYTDITDELDIAMPILEYSKADFGKLLSLATEAIEMAKADDKIHYLLSVIYPAKLFVQVPGGQRKRLREILSRSEKPDRR